MKWIYMFLGWVAIYETLTAFEQRNWWVFVLGCIASLICIDRGSRYA